MLCSLHIMLNQNLVVSLILSPLMDLGGDYRSKALRSRVSLKAYNVSNQYEKRHSFLTKASMANFPSILFPFSQS